MYSGSQYETILTALRVKVMNLYHNFFSKLKTIRCFHIDQSSSDMLLKRLNKKDRYR